MVEKKAAKKAAPAHPPYSKLITAVVAAGGTRNLTPFLIAAKNIFFDIFLKQLLQNVL